jgi:hypothetical protein
MKRRREARLVRPFYLDMMGLNAPGQIDSTLRALMKVGRRVTADDVNELLQSDGGWRPVVMGAWFSLKFTPEAVGPGLMSALRRCEGTLTAPPLAVSAALLLGTAASPALLDCIERDAEYQHGATPFVWGVVETLGVTTPASYDGAQHESVAAMYAVATRLQAGFRAF